MWWLLAIAAGAFGLFELNKHSAAAASQQQAEVTFLGPGHAYALVVRPSDPNANPLLLLQALTDTSVGAWNALGTPFTTTGAVPSPGANGTQLVPVLYLNPLASNDPSGAFKLPFGLALRNNALTLTIEGAIPL